MRRNGRKRKKKEGINMGKRYRRRKEKGGGQRGRMRRGEGTRKKRGVALKT